MITPKIEPKPCDSYYIATVEWLVGERRTAAFIRAAGLGIKGMGFKQRAILTYKPGEEVTEEKVMKALKSMIEEYNAESTKFEISCPHVIRIVEAKATPNQTTAS